MSERAAAAVWCRLVLFWGQRRVEPKLRLGSSSARLSRQQVPVCKQTLPSASRRVGLARQGAQRAAGCPRQLSGDRSCFCPRFWEETGAGHRRSGGEASQEGKVYPFGSFLSFQGDRAVCAGAAPGTASTGEWHQSSLGAQVLHPLTPHFQPRVSAPNGTSAPSALSGALVVSALPPQQRSSS